MGGVPLKGTSLLSIPGGLLAFWGEDFSLSSGQEPCRGARLSLSAEAWQPLGREGAPSPRRGASAVWTGKLLFVWGGVEPSTEAPCDSGALYDPATDSWQPIAADGAPPARSRAGVVWTGHEVVVLGGLASPDVALADAAAYDPTAGTWRSFSKPSAKQLSPRFAPSLFSISKEIVVLGGMSKRPSAQHFKQATDSARLEISSGKWRPFSHPADVFPASASLHAVQAGSKLLAWHAVGAPIEKHPWEAALYDVKADAWRKLRLDSAPHGHTPDVVFSTGKEIAIWGRYTYPGSAWKMERGGVLDPISLAWKPLEGGCPLDPDCHDVQGFKVGDSIVLIGANSSGHPIGARLRWPARA
jgi:hypothetical protein